MPGITAIIARDPRTTYEQELGLMVSAMRHDRQSTGGTYINAGAGIYLGWVSRRGSSTPALVWNASRTVGVIIYQAEAFADGQRPDGAGAFSVADQRGARRLIEMYETCGPGFPKKVRGCFVGVLVDLPRKRVLLFNDRYGLSRLYYHQAEDAFLFSSEAKSLLRVRPPLRSVDSAALGEYFTYGCTLRNQTLFSGVATLPGGVSWNVHAGQVEKYVYFSPAEWEEQPPLEAEAFYQRMAETFSAIAPRYFSTPPTIGVSLTGGLDTRMLLASKRLAPESVVCYTFAGLQGETVDVRLARRLAHALGQRHEVLRLGPDFLDEFHQLATETVYVTDGTFDVCGAHEIYLDRLAAEIAPVRMTGNFGSEIFRGVSAFSPLRLLPELFAPGFHRDMAAAEEVLRSTRPHRRLSFTLFHEIPRRHYGCFAATGSQIAVRTPYLDPDIASLMYRAPAAISDSAAVQFRFIREKAPELLRTPTDGGLGTNVPRLLRPLQRLVYRAGFKVDYREIEGLPGTWARFDTVLSSVNPFRRFPGPHRFLQYRKWFRSRLSEFVLDTLSDQATAERSYLNRAALMKLTTGYLKGRSNYTQEINRVLTMELVHRLLIEGVGRTLTQTFAVDFPVTHQDPDSRAEVEVRNRP